MDKFSVKDRYLRHIMLPQIGIGGQNTLFKSSICIIGIGGLGSSAAYYSVAAGIGKITLVDDDSVDISNIQRQILYTENDCGLSKVVVAKNRLKLLNSNCCIKTINNRISEINADTIIKEHDFVLDCTDSFATRIVINKSCIATGVPYVYGGVLAFSGLIFTVLPKKTACYACVFDEPESNDVARNRSCAGIVGSTAGIIGSMQSAEAVKYLTGYGSLISDRILVMDALDFSFRSIPIKRQLDCPVCKGD